MSTNADNNVKTILTNLESGMLKLVKEQDVYRKNIIRYRLNGETDYKIKIVGETDEDIKNWMGKSKIAINCDYIEVTKVIKSRSGHRE